MLKRFQYLCLLLFLYPVFTGCSKKLIPDRPFLTATEFRLDSLPESEINIPIQAALRPIYQMVEKSVDTVFTSPDWPNDWVDVDCATRYKYHFRRGPLQLSARGRDLELGFMGFYKIIGSTRICLGSTAISPWTPPCKCGFDEGERKVKVGFVNSVSVSPDYKLRLSILRKEPEPIDKCQVCVFGINITDQVMKGLKEELDLARKNLMDSFGVVDLKQQVQDLWNRLNTSYSLYGMGWLQLNPQRLRLNNLYARNDSLNIVLGLIARPVVRFDKPIDQNVLVPNMTDASTRSGFHLFIDAVLNYDSLSNILNSHVRGKRFDLDDNGKKYLVVKDSRIYGAGNERLIIKLEFSGTRDGIAYFTGKPFYDESSRTFEVRDIDFDVKTKNLLLNTAEWLFNRRITNELTKLTRFELSTYIDSAMQMMNTQLNRELLKGVRSYGSIDKISIIGFYPLADRLIIRSNATGRLQVKVDAADFDF